MGRIHFGRDPFPAGILLEESPTYGWLEMVLQTPDTLARYNRCPVCFPDQIIVFTEKPEKPVVAANLVSQNGKISFKGIYTVALSMMNLPHAHAWWCHSSLIIHPVDTSGKRKLSSR